MSRRWQELPTALKFLAPNLIGFGVFTAGPVLFSLIASVTNWNLKRTVPLQVTGLKNYADLIHDQQFWIYLANTLYLMIGIPFSIAGALWIAVLLNRNLRGIAVFRTLLYLPSFTSGVAVMILWKALYNPDFGLINTGLRGVLDAVGLHRTGTPQWLLSTHNVLGLDVEKVGFTGKQLGLGARDALNFMGIWAAIGGSNMLLYLAALSNVPEELLEAAQLDGAGRGQCFRHISWPQLAPTTFFIVVMSVIGGLQGGFETARVMTNGGPANTTTTIAYQIYSYAFERFQIGYASAISWTLFAIIFAITLLNWRYGRMAAIDG